MFDYEAPKEKSYADWSGTIIGAMLLPVLFLFIFLGKAEVGFTACIVLAMFMIAVRLGWKLRRNIWFWATVLFALLLHIPLLLLVHWPQSDVPTIVYALPLGVVDFLLISGAISLAQKMFSKDSSSDVADG
jgi:hypothetical protein